MSDTNFDPAKRCRQWVQELLVLVDDRDAVRSKFDKMLGILVADDNYVVGVMTLSTILKNKELELILSERYDELKNYSAYCTRYAECILNDIADGKTPGVYE